MRLALAALPVILPIVLTGCLGVSEPLSAASRGAGRATTPSTSAKAKTTKTLLTVTLEANLSSGATEPTPAQPTPVETAAADLAVTIELASTRAFDVAAAGRARDVAQVTALAAELAEVAAMASQQAGTVRALGGCGDDAAPPIDGGAEIGLVEGANDGATFAALAAEAAAEIVDVLNPESSTVCSGGCDETCEEVPGTVDEVLLNFAIDEAVSAGEGCAGVSEVLAL
jgi:hypothetical protein